MPILYPKPRESPISSDPLKIMKWCLNLHEFTGRRKYFWFVAIILKMFIFTGRTIYAIQSLKEPKRLAELVATYPIRFMAIFKLVILYLNRDVVYYLHETIRNEFWNFHIAGSEIEQQILKRFDKINILVLCHFSTAITILLVTILFPLIEMPEGMRSLPNIIWTPFDTNPSPLHEIIYVILMWNLALTIIGNAFYDVLIIYYTQHLFAQFILLKELLENISNDLMDTSSDVEKFNSDPFQEKVIYRLKICVKHHAKLLKFGKKIESLTSIVLLPQVVMSYSALVINGYIISVDHSEFWKTIILFSITTSCLVQLAIFAVQGSDVKCQSLSVMDSINNTKWYLFRAPVKKDLTFILLNTKKGLQITAGGMANVDNELLLTICQKVVSAITLLRALTYEQTMKK